MKFCRSDGLSLVLVCGWSVSTIPAASEPMGLTIPDSTNDLTLERSEPVERFIGLFFQKANASDSLVYDRFASPSARLGLSQSRMRDGYGSIKHLNSAGLSLFSEIGLDSLRSAALEAFPLDQWKDYWSEHLLNIVTGTIGNPEEEHVRITSSSYSALRLSYERANDDTGIRWGLRPWQTNPYAYILAHAGHMDGQSLLTFEGRARYRLLAPARFEGRLTLQLPASFRVAASKSYDLATGGQSQGIEDHFGVTLERVVKPCGSKLGSVFYLGFSSDINHYSSSPHQANYVVFGFAKPL